MAVAAMPTGMASMAIGTETAATAITTETIGTETGAAATAITTETTDGPPFARESSSLSPAHRHVILEGRARVPPTRPVPGDDVSGI